MFLAIDIGNTNIVIGLRQSHEKEHTFKTCWRLETVHDRTADEYSLILASLFHQNKLNPDDVKGIAICCVVPPLQNAFVKLTQKLFQQMPLTIGPGVKTGMAILYDNPKEVGADRIVNAIAAYHRFKKASLIVDFGTATTIDYVNAQGEYVGGVITPGVSISAEALFRKASKLPRVDVIAPARVVGKNTVGSIQSGLYYGTIGMVDSIVSEIINEQKLNASEVKVIATGGFANLLVKGSQLIQEVFPFLTLEGLEIVYNLNKDA